MLKIMLDDEERQHFHRLGSQDPKVRRIIDKNGEGKRAAAQPDGEPDSTSRQQ